MNHVNSKHNNKINNTGQKRPRPKRKNIQDSDNDIILQMENDYGRIVTINRINTDTGLTEKIHKCTLCNFERKTKYKIKPHIKNAQSTRKT